MKALFIGGTGTISMAVSKLAIERGWEVFLLNRGNRNEVEGLENAHFVTADINDEAAVAQLLEDAHFDVACDFIGFVPEQLERDYRLLRGKVDQFIYISSASAYQKPVSNYVITESTPLHNPYWEYSRNKIACEDLLMRLYREEGFPITIVRPSHTYDERAVPLAVHGDGGSFQVIKRMIEGKPVIVHGDGTSLWTITHNTDFARGFVGLMGNIHAIGEAVQIMSDESVTWNQIYQIVANALGVEFKPIYLTSSYLAANSPYDLRGSLLGDKTYSVVFDCSKLKRLVPDFVATKRADQGLRETVSYVMSHYDCQTEDPDFDQWCDDIIARMQ